MHSFKFDRKTPWLVVLLIGFTICGCATKKEKNNTSGAEQPKETVADQAHNSQNSLDWAGIYRGILPCEDCEGIKTEIRLNYDNSYTLRQRKLDDHLTIAEATGRVEWNDDGSTISLVAEEKNKAAIKFKVIENGLMPLNGNPDPSAAAEGTYALKKANGGIALGEGRWNLFRLYGEEVTAEEGRKQPYLIFNEAVYRVSGHNSCNQFSGKYTMMEGNRIEMDRFKSTLMACMPNNIEDRFMEVLDLADNYTLKGDTLSLNKAKMAPLAQFVLDYMQ